MSFMFSSAKNFNQQLSFETRNVASMEWMFGSCAAFNQPLRFDTRNVTDMSWMFYRAVVFDQPLLFDTSNVTTMEGMFSICSAFNQPLSFETRNVASMRMMFGLCVNFNQPLIFDTSKVTDTRSMFRCCLRFNNDISTWKVGNVRLDDLMFAGMTIPMLAGCPILELHMPRTGLTVIGPNAPDLKDKLREIVANLKLPPMPVVCIHREGKSTRVTVNKSKIEPNMIANAQNDILRYICEKRGEDVTFNWVAPVNKDKDWTCSARQKAEAVLCTVS
jgi:hypothetical protein